MHPVPKGLAEIAVWYSIALVASAFGVLFLMAALSGMPGVHLAYCFVAVLVTWLAIIGISTWTLVRSDVVARATTSLAPLHMLQAVLVLFTVPHAIFAAPGEDKIWSGILLVWEVWGVFFTLTFLFLALLAKKRIGLRTWGISALVAIAVSVAVYRRL